MDVSSVSALPVSTPSRQNAGGAALAQAISAVSVAVPAQETVSPGLSSSNADASAAAGTRDATSPDSLAQAVKQVNDSFRQQGQNLYASFEKDKLTGINVVKIVDQKTNETIRQMPPKEMVALAQFLEDPKGMRGQLLNAKA